MPEENQKTRQPSEAAGSRRQRRQDGGRVYQLKVTLDAQQNESLVVRAHAAGLSRQRYLLDAALSSERRTVPERRATAGQFSVVLRELQGIATNVNQLAKVANASGHIAAGTADALAAVARLEAALAAAIDGLR